MLIEVAVSSVEDAIVAESIGAGRLEISSSLCLGGLTPSFGLVEAILERVSIPVIVLIRSRPGNFDYTEQEMAVMQMDVRRFRLLGIKGYAFGAMTRELGVHLPNCQFLMNEDAEREWVFHRAFDFCHDPEHSLQELASIGISRVMTSGQARSAYEGRTRIQKWISTKSVPILPAGSIRASHVRELIQFTECREIHVGMREWFEQLHTWSASVSLAGSMPPSERHIDQLDRTALKMLISAIRSD